MTKTKKRHIINKKNKSRKVKPIKIGTDCSGLETPVQALRNLEVSHEHTFSCDNDGAVHEMIKANFEPKIFYIIS